MIGRFYRPLIFSNPKILRRGFSGKCFEYAKNASLLMEIIRKETSK